MAHFEHEPAPDHQRYVRTVQLPSGKTIEVISSEACAAPLRELHRCPECDGDLVYPVSWEQSDPTHWEVSLRCPNCEWEVTDLFDDAIIQEFDETLDRGTESLVEDLRQLSRANMEEAVDRFAEAIAAGHVLPEDF